MLFYTGARRGSVVSMRWDDLDLDAALWTIPANVAKNKTATPVPLTFPAIGLLRLRLAQRAGEQWVYPSLVGQSHVIGLPKVWAGRSRRFEKQGPGRPADVAGNILSSEVANVLGNAGLRGNWLAPGDAEEDGAPGLVAELEAIAQSAYKEASGSMAGAVSRPARISEAKKLLGRQNNPRRNVFVLSLGIIVLAVRITVTPQFLELA
jgi:hypothetical protein